MPVMPTRGHVWFVVQAILFCAMLRAPLKERCACPLVLRAMGLLILSAGVVVAVLSYRTLGRSHSPWTTPLADGQLVTTGMYRCMRHPIYTGWILVALGWALLTGSRLGVGVALPGGTFYDLKAREEEKWLADTYAGYAAYQRQVKRFIPWIY